MEIKKTNNKIKTSVALRINKSGTILDWPMVGSTVYMITDLDNFSIVNYKIVNTANAPSTITSNDGYYTLGNSQYPLYITGGVNAITNEPLMTPWYSVPAGGFMISVLSTLIQENYRVFNVNYDTTVNGFVSTFNNKTGLSIESNLRSIVVDNFNDFSLLEYDEIYLNNVLMNWYYEAYFYLFGKIANKLNLSEGSLTEKELVAYAFGGFLEFDYIFIPDIIHPDLARLNAIFNSGGIFNTTWVEIFNEYGNCSMYDTTIKLFAFKQAIKEYFVDNIESDVADIISNFTTNKDALFLACYNKYKSGFQNRFFREPVFNCTPTTGELLLTESGEELITEGGESIGL
jgi:hypothetical protein